MTRIVVFIVVIISVFPLHAQDFIQDNQETQVNFKIKNFGSYVNGSFSSIKISSNFDKKNSENSFIKGTVDVESIDTNNNKRDNHLRNEDYFEVSKYPVIQLSSESIEKVSGNKFILTARLTIKAVTKVIEIPIEITQTAKTLKMKGMFSLNRRDYNVGGKSWILSDDVKIEITYKATR